MNIYCRIAAALALLYSISGCAVQTVAKVGTIDDLRTRQLLVIGRSTKADVLASLGPTRTIRFDSGYEVWVYECKGNIDASDGLQGVLEHLALGRGSAGRNEVVILFDPTGVATKTRVRFASN